MKQFSSHEFDMTQCKKDVEELGKLLVSKTELEERSDIQPIFKNRPHLHALIGSYVPDLIAVDRIAYEFPICGDFAADLVVGSSKTQNYCMIELEDAKSDSVFCELRGKATKEWGKRFEHGFSQLVDWFCVLDDMKNTARFRRDFGDGHCRFHGFLIIGRSQFLTDDDRRRLRWRTEKVTVNSHQIHCLTFDDLYENLSFRLNHYSDPKSLP